MRLEPFEWSLGAVIASIFVGLMAIVAATVGHESYRASEKAAAYKAYTECLHETKDRAIDIQQMFCGRIRDQL